MKCQNSGWTLGGRSVAETRRGAWVQLPEGAGRQPRGGGCLLGWPTVHGKPFLSWKQQPGPPPGLPLPRTTQKDSTAGPGSLRGGGNQNRDSGGWQVPGNSSLREEVLVGPLVGRNARVCT